MYIDPLLGYSTHVPALLCPTNFKNKKKNRHFFLLPQQSTQFSGLYMQVGVYRSTQKTQNLYTSPDNRCIVGPRPFFLLYVTISHLMMVFLYSVYVVSMLITECRGVGVSELQMSIRNSKSKILRTADGEKERERSIILTNGIIISSRIHMIDKQLPMQITRFINIGREPCYDFPITTAPRLSLSLRVDPERIHISFD